MVNLRVFWKCLLAASLVAGIARADALTDGIAAYRDGDYRAAVRDLDPLARNGSARARYYLGAILWREGQGAAAQRLFCQAAGQGDRNAMTACAIAYRDGLAGEPSPTAARTWFERAALAGDDRAMVGLARLLVSSGRDSDRQRGIDWLRRSNDPEAAFVLASLIEQGIAPARPRADIIALYDRAAEGGNVDAQNALGTILANGDGVPADPAAARRWFKAAADGGSASGGFDYAAALRAGQGGPADIGAAHAWYVIAGRLGDDAMRQRIDVVLRGMEPAMTEAERARSAAIVAAWRAQARPVKLPIME